MSAKTLVPLLALLVTACGSKVEFPSGEYEGTITSESNATAHVRVSLTEALGALSGRWETDGEVFDPRAIYVQGWWHADQGVAELDVRAYVESERGDSGDADVCAYRLEGPLDGSRITGTYFTHGCDDATRGTFDLTRR